MFNDDIIVTTPTILTPISREKLVEKICRKFLCSSNFDRDDKLFHELRQCQDMGFALNKRLLKLVNIYGSYLLNSVTLSSGQPLPAWYAFERIVGLQFRIYNSPKMYDTLKYPFWLMSSICPNANDKTFSILPKDLCFLIFEYLIEFEM